MLDTINAKQLDERAFVEAMIGRITAEFPRRKAATSSERDAQRLVASIFEQQGLDIRWQPFSFNDNLYEVLALHFGIGTLGTVVGPRSPALALALHLLAGMSYFKDSTRQGYWLRRLLPFKPSQNLLAVLPSKGRPRLRIVMPAHIDAAPTGVMFSPGVVKRGGAGSAPFGIEALGKSLGLVTMSQFALAGLDIVRLLRRKPSTVLRAFELALSVPGAITALLSLDVVARDHYVPGANDNLSGVAALPILARRLQHFKPDDVELVFVVTGAEEAGTGGALALAQQKLGEWNPENTVVLGIDTLSNGDLFWFQEGEIVEMPVAPWLERVLQRVAGSDTRFAGVRRFQIPTGATDALPFVVAGFEGTCIGAVDLDYGAPRHYHHPSDRIENLDLDGVMRSIDFIEKVIHGVIAERLGARA